VTIWSVRLFIACRVVFAVRRVLIVAGGVAAPVVGLALCSGGGASAKVLVHLATTSQTVVVPQVKGGAVDAYERLRAVGLRVSIRRGLLFDSLRPPIVARTSPRAGRRVASDSVVTLYLSCCGRARHSSVPTGRLHRFTVPTFAGGVVSAAYSWARRHGLDFRVYLGPLKAGAEDGLFANYGVSRQRPAAGHQLALGQRTQAANGKPGRLRRTPLTVWGTQPRPCTPPPGYTVIASSANAVITSHTFRNRNDGVGGSLFTAWYGCLRTVGERRRLTEAAASPGYFDSFEVQQVLLEGRFGAFAFKDTEGKAAGCEELVSIYDLRTGQPGDVFRDDCSASNAAGIDALQLGANGFAAWHTTDNLQPTELTGMSCPSVSLCVATDSAGNVLATTSPAGGPQAWSISDVGEGRLDGVSCPTETLCVAIGGNDIYTSTNPTGGTAAWAVRQIDGVGGLSAVACPSPSLCVATGLAPGTVAIVPTVATSTNPTGGAAAWSASRIAIPELLEAISCPSTNLCVAGGVPNVGTSGASIVTSTDPTGGASAWTATTGLFDNAIVSVSCPSTNLCVAGSGPAGNLLSSTNPTGGASAWTAVAGPTTGPESALSCASANLCIAGIYSGSLITSTNPTGGAGAWSVAPIPITGWLSTISCPSTTLCVAGDNAGDILTSSDPAGGPGAWSTMLIDTPPSCSTSPCLAEHVYAYDTQGTRVLDTSLGGTGNTITNIQLSGSQLTWTNNGAAHHATLS
jgi:hypothetical protein